MRPRSWCALALTLFAVGTPVPGQTSAPGRTIQLNGIDMHYEVRGSGEPLLLLHGFGGCGREWRPFADSLVADYQVIIPDLRGHGTSTNPGGAFTHRQAARDVFALLDRLGVRRIKAMGISSGGMTLLHMATQQPERVDAMILIGATSYFPEQARAIMRRVASDSMPAGFPAYFARCVTRGDSQRLDLLRQFGSMKDSYDDMNFTAPFLSTIRARTLIVHGDRDEFFPVSIAVEMYHGIPASALWIVPRGDHVPIFGANERSFLEVSKDFLRNEPGRP